MKSGIAEIVHIIPLGQEFDRAVRPFDSATANHVYLITNAGRTDENSYAERVVRYLKKKHIPTDMAEADFSDMSNLLMTLAFLIRREQDAGNIVYVNMSAAGELVAAAATLAGMALKARVYCVHADRYASDAERTETGVSVCTENTVSLLPMVDIHLPEMTELPILAELYHAGDAALSASDISTIIDTDDEDPCMTTYTLNNSSISYQIDSFNTNDILTSDRWEQRKIQSRNLMKVSGMMKRMEDKGYVTKSKHGRKMMYQLTERGRYALILSGRMM